MVVPVVAAAPVVLAAPASGTAERTRLDESTRLETPWLTIVWNDPVNLMDYVTAVFRRHFGLSAAVAEQRMLEVHTDGRSVLARGSREEMERHVEAMHEYGLMATVQKDDA